MAYESRRAPLRSAESEDHEELSDSEDEEPDHGDSADGVPFSQVLEEETEAIDEKRRQRCAGGGGGQRFSVAFSGGGVRAAAFQTGVLWRLAEMGKLKDVDYLTAVSGGGYIAAAYASHVLAEEPPASGASAAEVDAWYRAVVARTITRFQRNAGNFVRDCVAIPGVPTDGSGICPRICDLPIMLLTLVATILTNPTLFMVMLVFPATESIDLFFGSAMRAALCAPPLGASWWRIFQMYSPIYKLLQVIYGCTCLLFILWFMSKTCLSAKDTKMHLALNGAKAFLTRFIIIFFVFAFIIYGTLGSEMASYEGEGLTMLRLAQCRRYIGCDPVQPMNAITWSSQASATCALRSSYFDGGSWVNMSDYREFYCSKTSEIEDGVGCHYVTSKLHGGQQVCRPDRISLVQGFTGGMTALVVLGIVLIPFSPTLIKGLLSFVGPAYLVVIVMTVVEFRVFGAIFIEHEEGKVHPLSHWLSVLQWSMVISLVALPFLNEIRGLWHRFYRRSLRLNFFADGQDRKWSEMKHNAFCPFMIFTGTVSDFKRPEDEHTISEVSFSPLFTGSDKCGYEPTPHYRSLSKGTALTGAGCLDAISLSMNDHLRLRFWLEVLNLSWGDYILFHRHKFPAVSRLIRMAFPNHEEQANWFFHSLPSVIMWLLVYGTLLYAVIEQRKGPDADCDLVKKLFLGAINFACVLIGLSFFGFFRMLDWLMFSVLLRNIQQATQYYFKGERPPSMLYVTDGGVQDCTALVQLMRRRCERILLVLAAQDPDDDLGVLRAAMQCAKREKLGCFYDPSDPQRDIDIMFEEYKSNRDMTDLHVGIRYGWDFHAKRGTGTHGHLVIVKNKLPENVDNFRFKLDVVPHITESEVMGESVPDWEDFKGVDLEDAQYSELGGMGCCDCCHTSSLGNCGRKWPQLTFTGYLYLTPQICNGLSRLAHAMSERSISLITSPRLQASDIG
eukprot:TRINITY_DN14181_c0_g1_i2.p1 TRINITY_DN14181_c0_g1~~TRINITY_DN14181_c0_g1_i2.p1  ORF type:complete len:995 (+),score=233.60 TRINITY_DN14181_c0_g1_i2:123-2987(+)